tara:strand:+ start:78 stop:980 length:903 start_codon:yes stop_codon:yes gene_type:complete
LKTLLILGASGFFGQSLIDYTKKFGLKKWSINKVILISRRKIKIKKKIRKVQIIHLRKEIKKIKFLPKADYIFYFINEHNQKKSLDSFKKFNSLIKNIKEKTSILFTSSGAVYGLIKNKKETNESKKINTNKIDKFNNYKKKYALNKYKMENILKKTNNKKLIISILRCFTFIGKEILLRKQYAISDFINSIKSKNKIVVKNPLSTRSYMNPIDLSEWLLTIASKSNSLYQIVNVGSDHEINMKNLSKKISKKYDRNSQVFFKANKDKDYYVPTIQKAKIKFRLRNRFSFDKSLDDILNI